MNKLLLMLLSLLLFNCTKDEIVEPIVEEEIEIEIEVEEISTFGSLLGTWKADFRVFNQDTFFYGESIKVLHIEEDDILTDAFAIGYMQSGNNGKKEISVELPIIDGDSIIMRQHLTHFHCNYYLPDENHLEIDDSSVDFGLDREHYIRF